MFKYQFSWKSVQWEPSCSVRMDGGTTMKKLIVSFRNFANSPNKRKPKWIAYTLRNNCILQHVIERKMQGREDEEEEVSSYWVTLRKREAVSPWKRKNYLALSGKFALEHVTRFSQGKLSNVYTYTSTCVLFYYLILPQREECITKGCYFLSNPTRCSLFPWNHFINLDETLQINTIYNLNTTSIGLRVTDMDNKHGRKKHTQNITAEDCKENTWTYERKERHRMRKKNKGIKDIWQGAGILKFIKYLRLSWYSHVERMKNQRLPK